MTEGAVTADHVLPAPRDTGRLQAVAWGSGSFPQTLIIFAFGGLLFRYLTDTVAIGAALAGGMIALSKIYDASINPLIGWVSDRVDTPMGRRRPWMAAGGVCMGLSMALLFHVPASISATAQLVWIGVGLFFYSNGYSLFAIPWLAMPSEMTTNPVRRTQMMAWRVTFSAMGQGVCTLAGPVLLAATGMTVMGYSYMGWIFCGLSLFGALATVAATRSAAHTILVERERLPPLRQIKAMAGNKPFVVMVLVKCALYTGLGFHSAAMALLTQWVLHLSDFWLGAYTLATTVGMVASQPLWVMLGRAQGRRLAFAVALGLHVLSLASLFFNPGWPVLLILQAIPLGAGAGGVFMLSQTLLPDVIEHDHQRTGMRGGGSYAGVVSLLETGAAAGAIFLLGIVLSHAGYVQGLKHGAQQPASAVLGIRYCVSLFPAGAEFVSLLLLGLYRLDPERESRRRAA
jgi:GPH family glycoside/pentoside/hexuronide:cation symporter